MKFEIIVIFCFVVHYTLSLKKDASSVDSRLERIEELDIRELLNVSLTSARGYREANIVYAYKYRDLPVEIGYTLKNNCDISIRNDDLHIGPMIAEQFFMAFGPSIGKVLSIAYIYVHGNEHNEFGKLVNNYCSETLLEFQAKHFKEGTFDDMHKPFKNVQRVDFDGFLEKSK